MVINSQDLLRPDSRAVGDCASALAVYAAAVRLYRQTEPGNRTTSLICFGEFFRFSPRFPLKGACADQSLKGGRTFPMPDMI